jgi:hypothetical protein
MIAHDTTTPDVASSSDAYAKRFEGPVGRFMLEVQERAFDQLLATCEADPRRVLLVGGGHGQLVSAVLRRGCEVWIQGSSPECRTRLAPLIGASAGRLQFATSSLWALPFPDRAFDLVVGIRLLAHVIRWRELLVEIARVCRHHIVVDYPPVISGNLFSWLLFPIKHRLEGKSTRPFFCYRDGQLKDALHAIGFGPVQNRRQLFLPMVVHRTLGRAGISESLEASFAHLGLTALFGSPAMLLAKRIEEGRQGILGAASPSLA